MLATRLPDSTVPCRVMYAHAYQVLSQLDEYSPTLLKHLEGAVGASLVAGFEEPVALFRILDGFALAEGRPVAAGS